MKLPGALGRPAGARRFSTSTCSRRWRHRRADGSPASAAATCRSNDPGRGGLSPQGIYAEALYPRYHFGWSELQSLTDDRFSTSRRRARSSTTSSATRGSARTWPATARRPPRRCDPRSTRSRSAGTRRAVGGIRRGSPTAGGARLRRDHRPRPRPGKRGPTPRTRRRCSARIVRRSKCSATRTGRGWGGASRRSSKMIPR